ncbi:MAG: bifunctional methylenetetrahydrofolate dehydrogenase/methenyltetrahydrofolate cyclohydrolase FolD [Solobacterium sp.]|nr:bifunctional methylenetetrahydrofolate dehydrogenase/methenyltetrahydrofolate cyclohydrolase FolD [Solobacterium sp.]
MGKLIYGSEISADLRAGLKDRIDGLKAEGKRLPCLAVILVGNHPASLSYIKGKEKARASVGIDSRMYHLEETASKEEVIAVIEECNQDAGVDGILVQLPLPKGLNEKEILACIDPDKDVDGLHPVNVGRLYLGEDGFRPCTPLGVMEILQRMGCDPDRKRAVVIGRSSLVGAPVARLLQDKGATVTIAHSHTRNLPELCREADILIVAIGRPKLVGPEYIKEGAYVVDVGINRTEEGKLVGDVDTDAVLDHVSAVTPVPKGVGPMTICMLLMNTMKSYEKRTA